MIMSYELTLLLNTCSLLQKDLACVSSSHLHNLFLSNHKRISSVSKKTHHMTSTMYFYIIPSLSFFRIPKACTWLWNTLYVLHDHDLQYIILHLKHQSYIAIGQGSKQALLYIELYVNNSPLSDDVCIMRSILTWSCRYIPCLS